MRLCRPRAECHPARARRPARNDYPTAARFALVLAEGRRLRSRPNHLQRTIQARQRLVVSARVAQPDAEVVPGLGIVGPQLQRVRVLEPGFGGARRLCGSHRPSVAACGNPLGAVEAAVVGVRARFTVARRSKRIPGAAASRARDCKNSRQTRAWFLPRMSAPRGFLHTHRARSGLMSRATTDIADAPSGPSPSAAFGDRRSR